MNLKRIIIIETILLILLTTLVFYFAYSSINEKNTDYNAGLLSPRVYAGLIEPKSYLILNYDPLRNYIHNYITEKKYNISVYVVNMRDGASMSINQNKGYFPASLNKLPLAILTLKQVEDGRLSLTQQLPINSELRNNASGTLYKTDSDTLSVQTLIEHMFQESDNTAYLVLNKYRDADDFNILLWNYFGYFQDEYDKNGQPLRHDHYVTVKTLYNVFSSLYLSTVLTPQHSEYLLSLLTNTTFNIRQIAQLPEDVKIAHKYGINDKNELNFHDCGIIYIEERRVFYCIMTQGLNAQEGIQTVSDIIRMVYFYTIDARQFLDEYSNQTVTNNEK